MTKFRENRKHCRSCPANRAIKILMAILSVSLFFSPLVYAASALTNFDQEWAKLVAAAKQEGTVAVASGGAPSRQYRPVVDVFQKKFGVAVEVSTGNATDTVNRVLAERKAGKYIMDVALISSRENNQRLVPSEALIPLHPCLSTPKCWTSRRGMVAATGSATKN